LALCVPATAAQGRVIVLGFDGADARRTEAMMQAGELPHLAQLAKQGTFAPLESTQPAESAAGWAALHTGVGPVQNGVASFIVRSLEGGRVAPAEGHVRIDTIPLKEASGLGSVGRFLASQSSLTLVAGGGLAAFVLLWGLFRFLFAMGNRASTLVALGLGAVVGAAFGRAHEYLDLEIPDVFHNRVQADGFWDYAARAGVPALVLDAALSFDRPATPGTRVLGGLGLPDATGAVSGSWAIYTDDPLLGGALPEGERVGNTGSGRVYLLSDVQGRLEGEVFGPVDMQRRHSTLREWQEVASQAEAPGDMGWKAKAALDERLRKLERDGGALGVGLDGESAGLADNAARLRLPLVIQRQKDSAEVTIGDTKKTVAVGQWSDWFPVTFEANTLVSAPAMCRVRLNSVERPLELYVSTFEIDPKRPLVWQPVSQPPSFAAEAAGWIGDRYETLGWSCMTNQLKDRQLSPAIFLEDIEATMDWRRKLTQAALGRDDWRLLFSVYSTPDRVQHMMYRFADPEHPGYDAALAEQSVSFFGEPTRLADTIPAIYRQMDRRVGEAMEAMQPEDVLVLVSDHGFTSFRRQVFVNNLLHQAGYLKLKEGVQVGDGNLPLAFVDWSRTQAYSLGLGMVFLNLKGREPAGIVEVAEARALLERIQADLLRLEDTGPEDHPFAAVRHPVESAAVLWDLYPGEWQGLDYPCADLMVGLGEFYRVAWSGVTGGMALESVEGKVRPASAYRDNTNAWSGDHASNDPKLVTGIFFCSRKLDLPAEGVSVMHVAPTVLRLLGVEMPPSLARQPLLSQ